MDVNLERMEAMTDAKQDKMDVKIDVNPITVRTGSWGER
jgi:hypothetical protein